MILIMSKAAASRSVRWISLLAVLVLLIALGWWLWPSASGSSAPGANAARGSLSGPGAAPRRPFSEAGMAVPVRVDKVVQGDFAVELKALGTVTASQTVNVRSRVGGELTRVLFRDGQQVKAGDLLAVIDPRAYQVALQQAEGALAQNQAQLKNAELDLKRYQGLYAEDSIAKQTLDTQAALVEQYRGTLKTNQAQVAAAKLDLDYTQIKAPIAGRLGLRQLDVGNLVAANDTEPLVVITQTQPMDVVFTLPEAELPQVLASYRGQTPLAVQAWDRGEKRLIATGSLYSLDNQIDTVTGTVKLKARFENADELLFPNQFVNVRLRVQTLENAILLPSSALQFGSKGTFVYVVGADSKIEVRAVETGSGNTDQTLALSGVQAGEAVVLEGTDRLRDGSLVEIIGASANTSPETPAP